MPAPARKLRARAAGDDAALAHEDQLVAAIGLVHHVAGDDERRARRGDGSEVVPELDAEGGIDAHRRLVEEGDRRRVDEGAGQREAPAHAARELAGERRRATVELDEPQRVEHRAAIGDAVERRRRTGRSRRRTARRRCRRPGSCSRCARGWSATASACRGPVPGRSVGRARPVSRRMSVVLPEPFGPSRP